MLAPQIETGPEDPALELGLAGRELYASLAPALLESDRNRHRSLERRNRLGSRRRDRSRRPARKGGLAEAAESPLGLARCRRSERQVAVAWPNLGRALGPSRRGRRASEPGSSAAGRRRTGRCTVVADTAIGIDLRGDRAVGVVGENGRYSAGDVILAAGAWAGQVQGVPRPVAVAPVRGQMAALPWPDGARPAIVYGHGCYMLARGNEAIVGSTMEYVGFHSEVSSAGLARIFASVTELCPALDRAKVHRTWAGLRPMTPDGLPIIGPEPRLDGLWYATGHGRNGILLAGITGVIIRQLLSGESPGQNIEACSPTRFWRW